MSLINKMLADLDTRHVYRDDKDGIVLDGLTPVTETGFRSSKVPHNLLWLLFFLLALAVAVHGLLSGPASHPQLHATVTASPVPAGPSPGTSLSLVSPVLTPAPGTVPERGMSADPSPGLKLDLSLPLPGHRPEIGAAGDSPRTGTGVREISLTQAGDTSTVGLLLDQPARFAVYPLENPDRLVVDIDDARLLQGVLPPVAAHPYIEQFRFRHRNDGTFRLVADLARPVQITDSTLAEAVEGYLLAIRFVAEQPGRMQPVPAAAAAVEVPEEVEFGRMDIRPSPAATVQSLFNEARQHYSERKFTTADEKILAVLSQQPAHVEARALYASSLLNRGNTAAAAQVLEAGLRLDPEVSAWAMLYARMLVDQGQAGQAVKVLEKALPGVEGETDYYAFYAALLQRVGRHEEAAGFYRSLLQQQSANELWWMGLAISLEALDDRDDALHAYRRSLEGDRLNYELRQYVSSRLERLAE